jgi:hypothetical protein
MRDKIIAILAVSDGWLDWKGIKRTGGLHVRTSRFLNLLAELTKGGVIRRRKLASSRVGDRPRVIYAANNVRP